MKLLSEFMDSNTVKPEIGAEDILQKFQGKFRCCQELGCISLILSGIYKAVREDIYVRFLSHNDLFKNVVKDARIPALVERDVRLLVMAGKHPRVWHVA